MSEVDFTSQRTQERDIGSAAATGLLPASRLCESGIKRKRRPDGGGVFAFLRCVPGGSEVAAAEEGHGYGAGAAVGAYHRADEADRQALRVLGPEMGAVVYVLLQQRVGKARVAQSVGQGEVHAAALFDELREQVVAVFGAARPGWK